MTAVGIRMTATDVISKNKTCGMSDQVMVFREGLRKLRMNGLFFISKTFTAEAKALYRKIPPKWTSMIRQTDLRKAK